VKVAADPVAALVLRAGVALASLLVAVGLALALLQGGPPVALHDFVGQPVALTGPGGIVTLALAGSPLGLVQLGVLVLVATPLARLIVAGVGFLRRGDWLYLGITGVVLLLVAVGWWLGER
jgi:uncharacterized membrane protein